MLLLEIRKSLDYTIQSTQDYITSYQPSCNLSLPLSTSLFLLLSSLSLTSFQSLALCVSPSDSSFFFAFSFYKSSFPQYN